MTMILVVCFIALLRQLCMATIADPDILCDPKMR
jgi:hypothetical protein